MNTHIDFASWPLPVPPPQAGAGTPEPPAAELDKIAALTNVRHLARVDDGHALVVSAPPGSVNLQTIALP